MKQYKQGDHIIVMYAVIPADKAHKVVMPEGSVAKIFQSVPIERYHSTKKCLQMGHMMAMSLSKFVRKMLPGYEPLIEV